MGKFLQAIPANSRSTSSRGTASNTQVISTEAVPLSDTLQVIATRRKGQRINSYLLATRKQRHPYRPIESGTHHLLIDIRA